MPRLSLYRPNRTNDYRFLDRTISEMYTVGGLDILVHKYLGAATGGESGDATQPVYDTENPLFIEDVFLLENRDRSYSDDVYVMRGVYSAQDIDFDLSQFGLFLQNDTLFITFHYNDMIDTLGRKLMNGDVLEFPNLKDYHPLDNSIPRAVPKYYVIQDAAFASEGFSQTWQPHLWRVKATPLVGSQEYNDILERPMEADTVWDNGNFYPEGSIVLDGKDYYRAVQDVPVGTAITDADYWQPYSANSILDTISTRTKDIDLNDRILEQAEVEVPQSGYDTSQFYIVPTTESGELVPADETGTPRSNGWTAGYLTGDGIPPNGLPVTPGVSFPNNPAEGDYALRLDYFPNRLFRFNGARWVKVEDDVRTDLTPGPSNETLRSGFVNNTDTVPTVDRGNIPSRQSLSDALKPREDN